MFLDAASPSLIDTVESDNLMIFVIGAIIIFCIIGIVMYIKLIKRKKVKK